MNGKLFVIDGTDGSGKQTQFNKLVEHLEKENIPFKKLSFPRYDNPSSSLVKMYLAGEFGKNAKDISPYVASTFFAVDRYAAYKQDFEQYYKKGGLVLADRYTTANMVHQAGKIYNKKERDKFLNWLCDFEYNIFGIPKPTETFFLNMPPDYATKLIENRENKITHKIEKDIHEKDKKHIVDSYNAACDLALKYNWFEIKCVKDGSIRTIDDIHNEIFEEIKKHI